MFHNLFKEVYFLPVLFPSADLGAAIVPSSYIDVSQFDRCAFVLIWGVTDRTTMTIQCLQATAAAGTGSKAFTVDQINTSPGALDDNKWAAIEFSPNKMDLAGGFRYVAVQCAVAGGAAGTACVIFLGWRARGLSVTQVATAAGGPGPGMFEYKIF